MVDVSIIVPVYNVEKLLERCVSSLINQTYKNIEIILIDDGSTDGSGSLCDSFSLNHNNVTVVHQKNEGLSSARNTGLHVASGEYVLFVDSDDYIKKEACERLLLMAKQLNCEIVAADSYKVIGNDVMTDLNREMKEHSVFTGVDFLVSSIKKHRIAMCAPYALYKKSIIIKNGLFFEPGILHEDELWTPQIYLLAKRVCYIDFKFYYHWFREGSITQSTNYQKRSSDLIKICEYLYVRYKSVSLKYRKHLNDYLCILYLNAVYIGKNENVERLFPIRTAWSLRNRIKSVLFAVSPRLYLKINECIKENK